MGTDSAGLPVVVIGSGAVIIRFHACKSSGLACGTGRGLVRRLCGISSPNRYNIDTRGVTYELGV